MKQKMIVISAVRLVLACSVSACAVTRAMVTAVVLFHIQNPNANVEIVPAILELCAVSAIGGAFTILPAVAALSKD